MSKGSPQVVVRLPGDLPAQVEAVLDRSMQTRPMGPFNFAEFVRIAVVEKLAKMERCRKWRIRKRERRAAAAIRASAAMDLSHSAGGGLGCVDSETAE